MDSPPSNVRHRVTYLMDRVSWLSTALTSTTRMSRRDRDAS